MNKLKKMYILICTYTSRECTAGAVSPGRQEITEWFSHASLPGLPNNWINIDYVRMWVYSVINFLCEGCLWTFQEDPKIIYMFAFYLLKLVLLLFYRREQMCSDYNVNLETTFSY